MSKFFKKGFTIIEIMIVLLIIGALAAIAIPNYLKTGKYSTKTICINNLKQIDSAIDRWALDYNIEKGTIPTKEQEEEIYSYVKDGKPKCPSKGEYTIDAVGSEPQVHCSHEEDEDHKLPE